MGEALITRRGGSSRYKIGYFQGDGGGGAYHDDFLNAKEVLVFCLSSDLSPLGIVAGHFQAFDESSWSSLTYVDYNGMLAKDNYRTYILQGTIVTEGESVFYDSADYQYIAVY